MYWEPSAKAVVRIWAFDTSTPLRPKEGFIRSWAREEYRAPCMPHSDEMGFTVEESGLLVGASGLQLELIEFRRHRPALAQMVNGHIGR